MAGSARARRSREQYDAIISAHTISNAAIASGALALAENYVLTREAFVDYLDRLAPDGVLYFIRPETQIARLVATGRESLAARGVADPAGHFYLYNHPFATPQGPVVTTNRPSFRAGFLMKKSPFTPEEVLLMHAHLGIGRPAGRTLKLLYSPLEPHEGSIYHALLSAPDPRTVYAAQTVQLEPTTDRSSTSTRAGRASISRPSGTSSHKGGWDGWRSRTALSPKSRCSYCSCKRC